MTMSLAGVTPEWTKRDFTYSLKGRFIDRHDLENKLRVCVLIKKAVPPFTGNAGKSLLKKYDYTGTFDMLIGHNELLGKTVQINGMTFTVVGILEGLPYSKRPSTILAAGQDYNVLAPIPTLMQYDFISPSQSLDLSVDTGNEQSFEDSLRRVQNFLKVHFGDEDFFIIENQLETIREFIANSVKASLMTISLGMLAFIAGGIGIMNVTLATVFARTKEIGIRRAIGASRGDIMMQFIVEAVMLGFIGGVLGSGIGYLWGVPVKVMIGLSVSPIKPWMPFISIFIAAFTAFLFAIYPAWVAAGLKPADALRAE
jgi:putative ABC transport system permease protein